MKSLFVRIIFLVLFIVLLSGCAGYDRVLFVTKTNVGLDIDQKPPTAEITIARRELAITPTYQDTVPDEKEKTLPLLASFGLTGNFINPEITSQFAGGDAAITLAKGPNNKNGENSSNNSSICLNKAPDTRPPWKKLWHKITFQKRPKENTRAFYFATDTSFGLKVGWNGTGGPYPDNLKLGYNRKEFAFPPIFVKKGCDPKTFKKQPRVKEYKDGETYLVKENGERILDEDGNPIPAEPWYEVKVPSFYASLDNASSITEWTNSGTSSGTSHVQFFATGEAAKKFVERESVLQEAFNNMAPDAARREASRLGLQKALIEEIISEFNKDTANKKDILDKGAELELIPKGTIETQFPDELRAHIKSLEPDIATKLNDLRLFAAKKQGTQ